MIIAVIVIAVLVFIGFGAIFGAPYIPSHRKELKALFDNAVHLTASDTVLDIGSGDGAVLREASRRGARAVGYEIHPLFVWISRILSSGDSNVSVRWANAWVAPFPQDVTVVYIFSVGRDNARLAKKVQKEANRLQKTLTLVCYGNPLRYIIAKQTYRAYSVYSFKPLHLK